MFLYQHIKGSDITPAVRKQCYLFFPAPSRPKAVLSLTLSCLGKWHLDLPGRSMQHAGLHRTSYKSSLHLQPCSKDWHVYLDQTLAQLKSPQRTSISKIQAEIIHSFPAYTNDKIGYSFSCWQHKPGGPAGIGLTGLLHVNSQATVPTSPYSINNFISNFYVFE
jgi:hypothetical protein